ncbi:putative lipase 1 [[Candida] railenensis]|uniref:Lipase 1 n=1 Tax=[Candida] railenensis TaxID=45579 RepID=A0A9P0QQR4_9ASCO|nr:putative lipase 1 [[Candida] railenensis]
MKLLTLYSYVCVLFHCVACAPAIMEQPLLPEDDSFYTYPDNLQDYQLGEVIKLRKTPHALRSVLFPLQVKNSWQILTRSSDTFGNATGVVSTVIEPYNANPRKLLSYQTPQDSPTDKCAPSYALQCGLSLATLSLQGDMLLVQMALNEGWWVIIPDYESKKSAFTAGRLAGKCVLDSIRGILNMAEEFGLDPQAQVAMWGFSGGSLASGWAAALQPQYAPELKETIRGAALGGFFVNITETFMSCDTTLYAGLIPTSMIGLSREYPQIGTLIDEYINPDYIDVFKANSENCLVPSIAFNAYATVFEGASEDKLWFKNGTAILQTKTFKNIITDITLGNDDNAVPQIPIFVYQGLDDQIVPSINTFKIYETWKRLGIASMEVSISNSTRHITEFILGAPAAFTFLKRAFSGDVVNGTVLDYRYSNLDYPDVEPQVIELLFGSLRSLLGTRLGPLVSSSSQFLSTETFSDSNSTSEEYFNSKKRSVIDFDDLLERYLES